MLDGRLWDTAVPLYAFHPIVENALYHGILLREEKRVIQVGAIAEDDRLTVSIADDGAGNSDEKLHELLAVECVTSALKSS